MKKHKWLFTIITFALCLAILVTLTGNVHAYPFSLAENYNVGPSPCFVAVGDFNKNGNPDLAVVNGGDDNAVTVLLGNGDVTFADAENYAVGAGPRYVVVGDFNGNGNPDLAVANRNSNNVSILLGDGEGGFADAENYDVGSGPISVAVGDFNKNGNPDLAVANGDDGTVSILLGNGNGTFVEPVDYTVGSGPWSVAVSDFNKNGNPDLAIVNGNDNAVTVLLGSGDGTFADAENYAVGSDPRYVVVGDFNGNGNSDLAVANTGGGNVSILLGNGEGGFADAVSFDVGLSPISVSVGDYDKDGNLDLAVANANGNNVSILLGNGEGGFANMENYDVGSVPSSIVADDFNKNGSLDLVVTNYDSSSVSILLNDLPVVHEVSFSLFENIVFDVDPDPMSVAVGDFNKDGNSDLAVLLNASTGIVSILLGGGDGTFDAKAGYEVHTNPHHVAVGDFNKDGNPDLAVANWNSNNVSILMGLGDGTFPTQTKFSASTGSRYVAVGDFNKDGNPDLAVANWNSSNVSILLGDGEGSFADAENYNVGTRPRSIAMSDFNRNGSLDLVVTNYDSSSVSILLSDCSGGFELAVNYTVGSGPFSVAVGDFNKNGNPDLAVANITSNNVSILLGDGEGGFADAENYDVGSNPHSLVVGDFNSNGNPDLAVANSGGDNVSILLGNGEGGFADAENYNVGSRPRQIVAYDFNKNGSLDLVVANQDSSSVSILLNKKPPSVKTKAASAVDTDSATLNLSYTDGDNSSVDVRFVYRKAGDPTWTETSWVTDPDTPHGQLVTELDSGTTYDFKAQLRYNSTLIEGNILQFTTVGNDADLSALSVDPGILVPEFAVTTYEYTVAAAHDVETIDVAATLSDENASMTINGDPDVENGVAKTVTLGAPGTATPIDIVVTAEDDKNQNTYTVTINREQGVGLAADPVSPSLPGQKLTFTAQAEGLDEPLEYAFYYRVQGTQPWNLVRSYNQNNTLSTTTSAVGDYQVRVKARTVGSTEEYEAVIEHTIAFPPEVKAVSLIVDPASPTAPGEEITFTAEALGGVNPEYAFYYRPAGTTAWTLARGYSLENTFSASPAAVGDYQVAAVARSAGSEAVYEAYDIEGHTIAIPPVETVSLTADPPSPSTPGTSITFTAEAEGGLNPEYAFYYRVLPGGSWNLARDYSPDNSLNVTANVEGTYEVAVITRSSGSTAFYDKHEIIEYVISILR